MTKSTSKGKRAVLAAGIGAVLIFFCIGYAVARAKWSPVITINGQAITVDAWQSFLQEQKSATTVYYMQNYGCTNFDSEFWETEYDGITPHEYASQRAMEVLIEDCMVLQEASDRDLITSIDFATLKKEWRSFNSDRQSTVDENGVLYGPVEYSFLNYYRHLISNLRNMIAEDIVDDGDITDEELQTFYHDNLSLFAYMGDIQAQGLLISGTTEESYSRATGAKAAIEAGMDFAQACTVYASSGEPVEFTFTALSQKAQLHGESEVFAACSILEIGEVSEIIETQQGYYLLQTIHKVDEQVYGYEEVENRILDILAMEKVEHYLQMQRDNCIVTVDEQLMEKIKLA